MRSTPIASWDLSVDNVDNVQVAVDTEHHLIVAHEVTNSGSDRAQLGNMASRRRGILTTQTLEAVADRGYFSSPDAHSREGDHAVRRMATT